MLENSSEFHGHPRYLGFGEREMRQGGHFLNIGASYQPENLSYHYTDATCSAVGLLQDTLIGLVVYHYIICPIADCYMLVQTALSLSTQHCVLPDSRLAASHVCPDC